MESFQVPSTVGGENKWKGMKMDEKQKKKSALYETNLYSRHKKYSLPHVGKKQKMSQFIYISSVSFLVLK